jgi:hypothetical protein
MGGDSKKNNQSSESFVFLLPNRFDVVLIVNIFRYD